MKKLFKSPTGEDKKHAYQSKLEEKLQTVFTPFEQFTQSQIAASLLLLFAAIIAIIWASTPSISKYYYMVTQLKFGLQFNEIIFTKTLKFWVNDTFLTFFFFLVGLEIKREFLAGELKNRKRAMLILFAAIGGMAIPALLYTVINLNSNTLHGWGVPIATDTAFALGLLACFKRFLPRGIFTFVAAMAIIDDIGAILVIAFFYSSAINLTYLGIALCLLLLLIFLNYSGVRKVLPYLVIGIIVWGFMEAAGIHGTVAGILVAFTIPARPIRGPNNLIIRMKKLVAYFDKPKKEIPQILADEEQHKVITEMVNTAEEAITPLQRWESKLETPIALLVLPLFAFMNAGIALHFNMFHEVFTNKATLGIMIGLVIGKPLGISLFSYLALKCNLGALPSNTTMSQIFAVSLLAGIGFTMSLFVVSLAFDTNSQLTALLKLSIFMSSVIAGLLGTILIGLSQFKKITTSNN